MIASYHSGQIKHFPAIATKCDKLKRIMAYGRISVWFDVDADVNCKQALVLGVYNYD